ncbi:MAG: ABC transporter ATP-binding protein, partial [Methylococcales bacterium]|nr:ABC transporter ATP-binding protein [Methylococcales bacterium]
MMLALQGLGKIFQSQVVLHPLDLTVNAGDFLAIVGPSGSGKSTLLRLIAGLEAPSSGELYMKEHSLRDLPPAKRDMAMVFQDYALYPHLTVFDNMAFCLKMRKMKPSLIQAKVHQVAERLGLMAYLTRKPHQLSG